MRPTIQIMHKIALRFRVGALFFLATICVVLGQSAPTQTNSATTTAQETFRQEQAALNDQLSALIAQGATPAQIQAWQQGNATRIAAQLQRAQTMSASQPTALTPITDVFVPAGASADLESLITTQADLLNRAIQLHLQLQATGQSENGLFQQQNATELQAQAQTAQRIAAQSINSAVPIPDAPRIPANAPAKLKAFLTLRNQLALERAQLWNKYLSAYPSVRMGMIQQWEQQNAARLQQFQQQAQALSPTPNQGTQ